MDLEDFEEFVDFNDVVQDTIEVKKEPIVLKYDLPYNETTTLYYKAHRAAKTDPIDFMELNDENAFKFKHMWYPYTGERLKEDIFGPLYLNPVNILKTIYINKLNNLWISEATTNQGRYQGYYGDNIGIGDEFYVASRGNYPERYLFRLPIIDLYVPIGHKMSLVTMGPILTDAEINELDKLLSGPWKNDRYVKKIYPKIKSLANLKKYYDVAICKKPTSLNKSLFTELKINIPSKAENMDAFLNRSAVDAIKDM